MAADSAVTGPIHFIGIGGVGMSALAELALAADIAVQGSDVAINSYVTALDERGVQIFDYHDAANLGDAQTVVYSSAIKDDNPELKSASDQGLHVMHRSDLLQWFLAQKEAITVTGTHGKTTTTAMIAHMLCELDQDPSVAVGGRMRRFGGPSHSGKGKLFVAEADESDGSFLKYRPYIGVLTNIDSDHLDHYGTAEKAQQAFVQYLKNVHEDGVAIIGWDQSICREVGHGVEGNRLSYGTVIGCDVRGIGYECREGVTRFKAVVERDLYDCKLPMMGKHNVLNALCCLAVARALELDVGKAVKALASFEGVERRMSPVFSGRNLTIFDDYAHNPGKISACITAIKESWPDRKLYVVYQNHRYSRLETMFDELLSSFDGSDHVFVLPVYAAGETTSRDFSPKKLAAEMTARTSLPTTGCESFQEAVEAVKTKWDGSPAIVLTVGAGDVWKVADMLRESVV